MKAYNGDPALKDSLLAKLRAHREHDTLVKGTYWSKANGGFKGCAVGCLLEESEPKHSRYESEWGIPVQLAWLEDGIFEALPDEQSQAWPERFMGAIEPGADLSHVWPHFAIWLMIDEKWGVVNTTDDKEVRDICCRVAHGYQCIVEGDPLSDEDAEKLARAARAARAVRDVRAAWAAWDVWDVRAAWAAWDVWDVRAARAVRDVRAAWAAWDAWDVRAAFDEASADKLVELLQAAPKAGELVLG